MDAFYRPGGEFASGAQYGFALHEIVHEGQGGATDFRIIEANPAFACMVGRNVAELPGTSILALFPEIEQLWIASFEKWGRSGELVLTVSSSGDVGRRFELAAFQPSPGVVAAIMMDVTEQSRVAEELIKARGETEASKRAQTEFFLKMNHELRTPLGGVMGMLQLLRTSSLSKEQGKYADYAIQSCERLTQLISDILDFSRADAGNLPLHRKRFDPAETIREVVELFLPVAKQSGVELRWRVSLDIPPILYGDSVRLRQVLCNLAGNAFKFTQAGSVTLEASPLPVAEQGWFRVLFSVSDTGLGIPRDKLSKVFQPFCQVSEGLRRDFQGAGLGLSLCKELVDLMGGALSIVSEFGNGTTVSCSIPFGLAGEREKECGGNDGAGDAPKMEPKVLLAEDDWIAGRAAQRQLEKAGGRVTVVDNGEKVLEALRREDFDLVLMNVTLPIMDGVEATWAIRVGEAGPGKALIPIIGVTSYSMSEYRDLFLEVGMDDCLAKPVEGEALRGAIERVLADRGARISGRT